jgi:hypothetical protein
LRGERQEFLGRIRQTERDFAASATEFTRQISDQVARLTDQFSSYLDEVNRKAAGVIAAPSNLPSEYRKCSQGKAVRSDAQRVDLQPGSDLNGARQQPRTAGKTDIRSASVELSPRRHFGAMRLALGKRADPVQTLSRWQIGLEMLATGRPQSDTIEKRLISNRIILRYGSNTVMP